MLTFALGGRLARVYGLALFLPSLVAFLLLSAAPAAWAAHADEVERIVFDLPAQSLERALSDFGRLTGHSVLVDSAMTQGRMTQAVRGEFAPTDALRQLLAGSGLVARYSGRNAFTLLPEPAASFPILPSANDAEMLEPHAAPNLSGMPRAAAADFAGALQIAITKAMCTAQPDSVGRYRAALQLWIGPEGRILRARLLEPTGLKARDAQLLAQLKGVPIGRKPPPELAQPLTILLSPRPDPAAACRDAQYGGG